MYNENIEMRADVMDKRIIPWVCCGQVLCAKQGILHLAVVEEGNFTNRY